MPDTARLPVQQITAPLNFLVRGRENPFAYTYEPPPPGMPQRSGEFALEQVAIHDGRAVADALSLDREGFILRDHRSKVTRFETDDHIKAVYYPEVAALVRQTTGAVRVLVFDHNVRAGAALGLTGLREPAKRVHNDYTLKSGPQRVRDLLPDEAEGLLRHRFVFINVWRPIGAPVEESPLALCAADSMGPGDFVPSELRYRDRTGETYAVTYSPRQRWYHFPHMRPDEALFIKCYDSAEDGRARFTAHGAFDDPTSPANARPRQSIEARTIAFFDVD